MAAPQGIRLKFPTLEKHLAFNVRIFPASLKLLLNPTLVLRLQVKCFLLFFFYVQRLDTECSWLWGQGGLTSP